MGVSGLLPLLKSIQKPCSLKSFSGQTIGVDAYGWLHRGTIACAIELAQGKPTPKWLNFVMNRVRMLIHFGIKPYLVFDGDYLPSKSGTEKERAARRKASRKNGLELLRLGKTSQAHLELQKSIDVTPEMARQLIEELKKLDVDYVVAPYEADAQMVYMERTGIISGILSEDSDLLVFGAQCLLTKLDQFGDCIMINRSDFTACREISLVGWSDADFRLMAILSGCDYLASIDKMGLKTAYRLVRKHKTVDRLLRAVQFDGKMKVPAGYLEAFNAAEATFLYQWVYCPKAKCLVNFSEPAASVNLEDFPCIGKFVEADAATGVAKGDLHPHTKEPIALPTLFRVNSRTQARAPVVASTPDLKKHKSIESFFKPFRTPLAELDPNIFTPSPSQQNLLQRNPASWSAQPLNRRPLMARESPSAPSSAPHRIRRAVTDMPAPSALSPKRQRLCSDGNYATPLPENARVESGASKFFASKPSPSLGRRGRSRERATNEFNLWSDDSVEEAMSQLPDSIGTGTKAKSSKKLSVFKDGNGKADMTITASSHTSPTPSATQSTVVAEEPSQDEPSLSGETVFSSGLSANAELLRFKYRAEKPVPESVNPCKRPTIRIPQFTGKSGIRSPSPVIPCSSHVENTDISAAEVATSHTSRQAADDFDESDWRAAESRPLQELPGDSSSSKQRFALEETNGKGSEDMLVPDSESEEEGLKRTGFSFDLAQFAFTG